MKANIKTISEKTGYSIATVSNVLNGKKNISEETSAKILKVAKEIGYVTKTKSRRIKLVVYKDSHGVVDDTPFFSTLFEGISSECREKGFDIEIYNLDRRAADFEAYLRKILTEKAEGILFLGTELDLEISRRLAESAIPLLILDTWLRAGTFNSLSINNVNAAYEAAAHLLRMGHRKIGYLRSSHIIRNFQDRGVGLRQALEDHGVPYAAEYEVPLAPHMEGAYRDMCAYLGEEHSLATAYFADNDIIAFGAVRALKEHGVRIPDDVSIIGFDDMPYCEIMAPKLSTVRVPKQQMGRMAVRKLMEMLEGEADPTTHTMVNTTLVLRESVRELNGK